MNLGLAYAVLLQTARQKLFEDISATTKIIDFHNWIQVYLKFFYFFIWASKVVQSKRFKSLLQSIVVKRMKSCAHLNLHKTILVHVTGPPRCNIFYIILHISKKRIGMKYLISMHAITRP